MTHKKAFTLVELLVVIAIIGLLATISVIALQGARAKARDARRVGDIKQITTALELFFNNAGRYPNATEWDSGSLTYNGQTYLSVIPAAPTPADGTCDNTTNDFSYTQNNNGGSYTVTFCTGGVVGALSPGELCATPMGMAPCSISGGGGAWACGDTITLTSIGGHTCSNSSFSDTCTYNTVNINGQCWFKESLNIGSMVLGANEQNNNSILEKYCYDDQTGNCLVYGALYQWSEAMQYSTTEGAQGICPTGWHIPTAAETNSLVTYLGGTNLAGGPLKEVSNRWSNPNTGATDSSGFSALGTGQRGITGAFTSTGYQGFFWSSKDNGGSEALMADQNYNNTIVNVFASPWVTGAPIRCLKD
ncbi:MAG TPA: FISUMP domain-containing protein [bacterium]|nr:FISUMP domain-containing protein [bacterium]HPT30173.1 FISUMP domain-containing protein [bacterium]